MKKRMAAIAVLLLLSLAIGMVRGPSGGSLSLHRAQAATAAPGSSLISPINPGIIDIITGITPTPPAFIFNPGAVTFMRRATPTPPPVTKPPITKPPVTNPPDKTNPPATQPPKTQKPPSGGGQTMTSEGPLFLSFRNELTEELWMFTPMDLALDSDYHFPLIGNASQVVGEAKVVVRSGMVIVTYLVVNGVQVNTKNEFFTFFPDIRNVPSVKPSQLQHVKLTFGLPYSVAGWLNSDPNVLLYINCPVSYKTNLPGLTPFSFQDPAYLQRMMELLPLMD